jgi:hypothetical protein
MLLPLMNKKYVSRDDELVMDLSKINNAKVLDLQLMTTTGYVIDKSIYQILN